MSLDLDGKRGRAHNTVAVLAAAVAGITAATFNSGDFDAAGNLMLQCDTSAGDVDLNLLPTTLTGSSGSEALEDGVRLTAIKVNASAGKLVFTDPVTGIGYAYADRLGESITLVFDTGTGVGRWLAEI